MTLTLKRFCYAPFGVYGQLLMPGDTQFYTVERPWLHNEPNVSCIPVGRYELKRTTFHAGGYPTVELVDVPGRSLIKIHLANEPNDVQGCIGLGMTVGSINLGVWAVLKSSLAFDEFWRVYTAFKGSAPTHYIEILNEYQPTSES